MKSTVLIFETPPVKEGDKYYIRNAVFIFASESKYFKNDKQLLTMPVYSYNNLKILKKNQLGILKNSLNYEYTGMFRGNYYKGQVYLLRKNDSLFILNFNATPNTFKEGLNHFNNFIKNAKWGSY